MVDVQLEAAAMMAECVSVGQSARRVTSAAVVEPLRAALRSLARERQLHVRTAVMDDVVVIVRTDADIWNDDSATNEAQAGAPTSRPVGKRMTWFSAQRSMAWGRSGARSSGRVSGRQDSGTSRRRTTLRRRVGDASTS